MKKNILVILVALFLFPLGAEAHQTRVYEIGGKSYRFVVGSLGEPVVVDDKTGVDFRVSELVSGEPVTGLNETLQVELIAGSQKRVLELDPVHGAGGKYDAIFFPTLPTTLTYRFFGTINNTPVDLSFECTPAGHPRADEDITRVEVSEGVTRTLLRGGFGCPVNKTSMGFPENSASILELQEKTEESEGRASSRANTALIVGALGLVAGGASLFRKRK